VTKFGIGYEQVRDSSPQMIETAIEGSLQRLKTDYIDVYMVHWPDRETLFEETMRGLETIVQSGKARYIGLSNFTPAEITQVMEIRRIDVLQYGYNLFDQRMAKFVFPLAQEHQIGMMVYGSLAYGLLTGVFTPETKFGDNDWRRHGGGNFSLKLFAEGVFQRNLTVVDEIQKIADYLGKSLPQLALNWVLSNPTVSTALVGARRISEVEDNMGAIGWQLSDEIRYDIDRIFANFEVNVVPK